MIAADTLVKQLLAGSNSANTARHALAVCQEAVRLLESLTFPPEGSFGGAVPEETTTAPFSRLPKDVLFHMCSWLSAQGMFSLREASEGLLLALRGAPLDLSVPVPEAIRMIGEFE